MSLIQTSRTIGRTLKNAGRLRTIVSVFARHGFQNIVERVQLGRYLFEKLNPNKEIENFTVAERIRMSFEELGPTFVKLGQLLATRPDLVPESWVIEFEKLHASVLPLPFEIIKQVLQEEFGENLYKTFLDFDPTPLGSASIAQVHKATLVDGSKVVIKVQRPGIVTTISEDLSVLFFLAELLDRFIEETRPFNPMGVVQEYFTTLELETNFLVEANNIRRFTENFKDESQIKIPKAYLELSTERVLILEALDGIPLSHEESLHQQGVDPEKVIRLGLATYFNMVFKHGLFHGDLHAGNFFILPENHIGLIDFGVVGRLNKRTQTTIASMMFALATEDYDRLANEYVDLAPFNENTDVDKFARDLRDVVAPYYGLSLKNVNLGKILMKSAGVAARNHVSLPNEMMLFFKSVVTTEGLGRKIIKDFDFLTYSLQFAKSLASNQMDSSRILLEMADALRESKNLIAGFPRQFKQLLRKFNSPHFALKIELEKIHQLEKSIRQTGRLQYWGLIISSLILASTYVFTHPSENLILGMPPISLVGYCLAGLFGAYIAIAGFL
jgi:ubiquinone biosynthesis protein